MARNRIHRKSCHGFRVADFGFRINMEKRHAEEVFEFCGGVSGACCL
jgi:hypothetical protein